MRVWNFVFLTLSSTFLITPYIILYYYISTRKFDLRPIIIFACLNDLSGQHDLLYILGTLLLRFEIKNPCKVIHSTGTYTMVQEKKCQIVGTIDRYIGRYARFR